jgi:hypothetical protein
MEMTVNRYGFVQEKFPREVVLLKSLGCSWGKCKFCTYYLDYEPNVLECVRFNKTIFRQVQAVTDTLEVIDSASFIELPFESILDVVDLCHEKKFKKLIVEMHWLYLEQIPRLRAFFEEHGVTLKVIASVETFDDEARKRFDKGMPSGLSSYKGFDWVNLLTGYKGQTLERLLADVQIALEHFERVNVNMFIPNETGFERDDDVINAFYESNFFRDNWDNPRIEFLDILDKRSPDTLAYLGYENVHDL